MITSMSNEYVEDCLFDAAPDAIRPPMLNFSLALQVKEGIHITRAAMNLRSSFIVCYVDAEHPFEPGGTCIGRPGAIRWARRVLKT